MAIRRKNKIKNNNNNHLIYFFITLCFVLSVGFNCYLFYKVKKNNNLQMELWESQNALDHIYSNYFKDKSEDIDKKSKPLGRNSL